MRGKKYKAKDRTVQKAGRGGLMEINLHSHEQTGISSREKENAVRKAPDHVNYQKTRGRERSAGSEKRKHRRRAAVPGDKAARAAMRRASGRIILNCRKRLAEGSFLKLPAWAAPRGVCRNRAECRQEQYRIQMKRRCRLLEWGMHPGPEMTACCETCGPLAGMAVRDAAGQRHGGAVQPGLKYDAVYHPFPGQYGNAGGTEAEKAARIREDVQGNDMDAQDAHGRLSDAGGRPHMH